MKKNSSIVPKIILLLGLISILAILALFFRPQPPHVGRMKKPENTQALFAQVIQLAMPKIQKLWTEGDQLIKKDSLQCPDEILFDKRVGRSYYQCQPHLWQCYWSGGIKGAEAITVDLFGETFHVRAKNSFNPIQEYSVDKRFYEIIQGPYQEMNFHYGMMVELVLDEVPEMSWPIILTDTCRDVYLPQRIYGYGKTDPKKNDQGFLWDNFDRHIFIDKFYVSNQMVNEWKVVNGKAREVITDRSQWSRPALLSGPEQKAYCSFWGKRVMEAHLFDAASMTPGDLKNPLAERVPRPQTPWQRDLSKTFLGMSRINPDYQLTPLDCQLAQVQGCHDKYFSTDSVTWMGMNFSLGFYPEALVNTIDPMKNLKPSSKFHPAQSEVHELGVLSHWDEQRQSDLPVAFRCYEEVSL